eukprot:TRINITY_DN5193_c0_g1_i1.p1 TRINITY_DN5193_c0_g1~~TRINITY_DN5193_c0_g1_i1.p1  ORF type:complete len:184 (+),score=9.58 TRINITY_DN5193_c0_g1_i1:323-874(+)
MRSTSQLTSVLQLSCPRWLTRCDNDSPASFSCTLLTGRVHYATGMDANHLDRVGNLLQPFIDQSIDIQHHAHQNHTRGHRCCAFRSALGRSTTANASDGMKAQQDDIVPVRAQFPQCRARIHMFSAVRDTIPNSTELLQSEATEVSMFYMLLIIILSAPRKTTATVRRRNTVRMTLAKYDNPE